ncbi:polysaccharide deacetylase family protein [Pigmentibacter sp. JX0631]|uniref:polysaccharide deacetylase family protein n=1 Tax=Pigmentibacter sp. JX0631 TaxID=2976982 RepID=UPI002469BA03|nr:polysaccharide deacetylase family protein [Pigmentibacter sp. JX0631]WGL59526.1 polysaccharide deacetylase family protein [Pigmentibacter sp. JX0631]
MKFKCFLIFMFFSFMHPIFALDDSSEKPEEIILDKNFKYVIKPFSVPIQLAITIDDLPAAGPEAKFMSREEVSAKIIKALTDNKVPEVYGFMNGILLYQNELQAKILKEWKSNGFLLGNHTFSHSDLKKVTSEEFIQDIERNESILLDYVQTIPELKIFRFPYLMEGNTTEKRYDIRSYFSKRNYVIAQVTVDSEDWSYNDAFIRCKSGYLEKEINELIDRYITHIFHVLTYSDKLGHYIYGQNRKFPHILLLHYNPLNAAALPQILEKFKRNNVKLVPAKTAILDPIYKEDFPLPMKLGIPFFEQMRRSRKLTFKEFPFPYLEESWLNSICK